MNKERFTIEIEFEDSVPQDDGSILALAQSIAKALKKADDEYDLGIDGYENTVKGIHVTPAYVGKTISL